MVATTKYNT